MLATLFGGGSGVGGGNVRAELQRRKRDAADVATRAEGDLIKVKRSAWLPELTLLTVKWIAGLLQMGTAGYVNNWLYRWRKGTLK